MLEWTGERFLPWIRASTTAYEHLHRYAYAAILVKGMKVLDLACGEGYGSKMLSETASSVVGIDIDESVIRHASTKYGGANLKFLPGSITEVPLSGSRSFDAIVCFEAIEHVENHAALLAEVKRLLTPEGMFIVSTPNKALYHDAASEENRFHVRELYFEEFRDLLTEHFRWVHFLGQRIHPSSSIWPVGTATSDGFHEFVIRRGNSDFEFIGADQRVPLYFIAIAFNAFPSPSVSASVLLDESDSLLEEKDEVANWRQQQLTVRDETIGSLEEALRWRDGQLKELTEGLEWMKSRVTEMEKTIASADEALAWRAQQVTELQKIKEFWERKGVELTAELGVASATLAGIYASRGWKFVLKIRRIRDRFKGLVKFRV